MDIVLNVRSEERWINRENCLDYMLGFPYFGTHGSNICSAIMCFHICHNLLDSPPFTVVLPCLAEDLCRVAEMVPTVVFTLLGATQKVMWWVISDVWGENKTERKKNVCFFLRGMFPRWVASLKHLPLFYFARHCFLRVMHLCRLDQPV